MFPGKRNRVPVVPIPGKYSHKSSCPVRSSLIPSHGTWIQVLEQVAASHTSSTARLELLPEAMLEAGGSLISATILDQFLLVLA